MSEAKPTETKATASPAPTEAKSPKAEDGAKPKVAFITGITGKIRSIILSETVLSLLTVSLLRV